MANIPREDSELPGVVLVVFNLHIFGHSSSVNHSRTDCRHPMGADDGMGRSVAVEPRSLMLPPHYFSKEHNIVAGVLLGRQFNPLLPSKFDTGTDAGDPDSAEQQSANRREKETI